jgi:hypothetical protein
MICQLKKTIFLHPVAEATAEPDRRPVTVHISYSVRQGITMPPTQ